MKRELKFRVWDKKQSIFIDLTCGHNNINLNKLFKNKLFIFQQFTGLLDKNGREIYEGDILAYKYKNGFGMMCDTGIVKYNAPSFYLHGKSDRKNLYRHDYRDGCLEIWQEKLGRTQYESEIIGNIYQNPKLLK